MFSDSDQGSERSDVFREELASSRRSAAKPLLSVAERRRRSPRVCKAFQCSGLPFRFFRIESPRISMRWAL